MKTALKLELVDGKLFLNGLELYGVLEYEIKNSAETPAELFVRLLVTL